MTDIIIKGKKDDQPERSKLEGVITKILLKAGVTGVEVDECICWAFGKGALYVPIYPDWPDRWQKLHPKAIMKFTSRDSFTEWMYVIGFLFCSEKHKARTRLRAKDVLFYPPQREFVRAEYAKEQYEDESQ